MAEHSVMVMAVVSQSRGCSKHCFVNLCSLVVLELSVGEDWWVLGQKVLSRASWNDIFFQPGS